MFDPVPGRRDGHNGAMGVLSGEARDRLRASTMWFVAGMLVVIVLLLSWGSFVGFTHEVALPATGVAGEAPQQLSVSYSHDRCQQPDRVEVREGDEVVTLTAWVRERRPWLTPDCEGVVTHREQLRLQEPLGEREIRPGTRAG